MRGARALLLTLLVGTTLAGCVDTPADDSLTLAGDGDDAPGAAAFGVVAFIDTGINPYHDAFASDDALYQQHPSTYLPDYPVDAEPLNLSLDGDDYWEAVRADCEDVWAQVEQGQLYYVPGTRIVGAIFVHEPMETDCAAEEPVTPGILDEGGHGTMVASRGAGNEYGACPECLVVAVEGFSLDSVAWAADQADWIDAQSNSWGPFLPVPSPVEDPVFGGFAATSPAFAEGVEAAAAKQLSFWASGNGAANRFGAVGHVTLLDPRLTPSVVIVGGHDSGYVNTWPSWPPHVVSDACSSWAAEHRSVTESGDDVGGGTSGATPFVAGKAARLALAARELVGVNGSGVVDGVVASGPTAAPGGPLDDGELTVDEWRELLYKTASSRPTRQEEDGAVCSPPDGLVLYSSTPVAWEDVPEDYPAHLHLGYGAVDGPSEALARSVLAGDAALPERGDVDAYFEMDAQARRAYHDAFTGLG